MVEQALRRNGLAGIPVVLGASFLVFSLLFLIPGDPVDALTNGIALTPEQRASIRTNLGLDQPFVVQYGRFLAGALRSDLGRSLATGRPVALEIQTSLAATLDLAGASLVIALGIGSAILVAAALSFLGPGTQPPTPEWGRMLSDGGPYLRGQWWIATLPGLAIMLTALAVNLPGDGLRDALDPRCKP